MISILENFIDFEDKTKDLGREIWKIIEPQADAIVRDFYAKVKAFHVSAHITDEAILRLIDKQKQHWTSLFCSGLNSNYANSVRKVGVKHRDITLGPMWYVLGYMQQKMAFTNVIISAPLPPIQKGRLIIALDKYITLDMALALSIYNAEVLD
jgi:hypothetical protein